MYCHKMVSDLVKIKPELESNEQSQANSQAGFPRKLKPLEEVTCYKVIIFIVWTLFFVQINISLCTNFMKKNSVIHLYSYYFIIN